MWFRLIVVSLVVGVVGLVRVWPAASVMHDGHAGPGYYLWSYRHLAYSDLVAEYTVRNLYTHSLLYVHQYFEYPPGIGLIAWLTAWLPGLGGYLIGNTVVLTGALVVSTAAAAAVRGWQAVRPWMYSPLLLIYTIYNWDMVGLACYGAAVWAWSRRRWFWSGVFIGLGAGTKLFPAVLWPFFALALWRDGRRRAAGALTAGAGLGFAVLDVPVMVASFHGWEQFWVYNTVRGPDPGVWQWISLHHWLSIGTINLITFALVAAGAVLLLVWVGRGFHPVLAAALLLTWWLLCNKVYSPQYMIWVLYAVTIAETWGPEVWWVNVAGILDFGLAMVWLALGTAGSPAQALMGIYVAPVVILVRDVTFGLVLRRHRWQAEWRSALHSAPLGERT